MILTASQYATYFSMYFISLLHVVEMLRVRRMKSLCYHSFTQFALESWSTEYIVPR